MGYALLILLVLAFVVIGWLRWNSDKVQVWMARRLQRHLQKQMRRQMEEAMRKTESEQQQARERVRSRQRHREPNLRNSRSRTRSGHIIPPEYAEDVDFDEVRTYDGDICVDGSMDDDRQSAGMQEEEQVSDVEWTDILPGGKSGRRHTIKR